MQFTLQELKIESHVWWLEPEEKLKVTDILLAI